MLCFYLWKPISFFTYHFYLWNKANNPLVLLMLQEVPFQRVKVTCVDLEVLILTLHLVYLVVISWGDFESKMRLLLGHYVWQKWLCCQRILLQMCLEWLVGQLRRCWIESEIVLLLEGLLCELGIVLKLWCLLLCRHVGFRDIIWRIGSRGGDIHF